MSASESTMPGIVPMRPGPKASANRQRQIAGVVEQGGFTAKWIIFMVLIHVGLALLMKRNHSMASYHALITILIGLWICFKQNHTLRLAQWVAYVVGAEVLWRMCKAQIPWETAKHSISLFLIISLIRTNRFGRSWAPWTYILLLIPGGILTFILMPLEFARQEVSFNLSGPMCLAVCVMWFKHVRLTPGALQRLGVMIMVPIAGVATLAVFSLATTGTHDAAFGSHSNATGSGGYGPNQVSAMLSLAAMMAIFLYMAEKKTQILRGVFVVLALWYIGQSAMTFSRTGLYLLTGSFAAASFFLVQQKGGAIKFILLIIVVLGVAAVILPILDNYTGGALTARFSDKGLTGRDDIAKMDLEVFREHMIFGAGAGMSVIYRTEMGESHTAHTEYSRLLADHGLPGVVALFMLLFMIFQALIAGRNKWSRAIVAALSMWSLLFMAGTGMRLAAPSFALGLIHAGFLTESDLTQIAANRRSPPRSRRFPGGVVRPGNRAIPIGIPNHAAEKPDA